MRVREEKEMERTHMGFERENIGMELSLLNYLHGSFKFLQLSEEIA